MKFKISFLVTTLAAIAFSASAAFAQDTVEFHFKQGGIYLNERKYKEADASYTACLKLNPIETACMFNRGLARYMGVGYGLALEDFNKVIILKPNHERAYRQRAMTYYSMKQYDKALPDFDKAIQLKPDYAEAYYNRANLYRDTGKKDLAIADYTSAVKYDPKHRLSYLFRGAIYEERKDLNNALLDYDRAVKIDPNDAYALFQRGSAYFEMGKKDLAEVDFQRAIQLDRKYETQVKTIKILESSRAILAGNSNSTPPAQPKPSAGRTADDYFRTAFDQSKNGNKTAAIASYGQCVAADPKHRDCFYNRGYIYWELKDFANAEADFTKAIALKPNDPAAYNMRGTTYYQRGMYTQAISDYTRTVTLDPQRYTAFYNRGLCYVNEKKYTLAKLDFTKTLKIKPDDTDAMFQRGKLRSETNDKSGAIADLKAVLKIQPTHQRAKELLATLEAPPAAAGATGATKSQPSVTPAKLPVLSQALAAKNYQRAELTGTGLSVQSPTPFQLKQDKPDPLIENQTANVFWTLSHQGIFANVRYVKETGGKNPRTDLEETAKILSETNRTPMPRLVDVTFLGQPAVQFEEEFVDAYDPKKEKRKRKMLAYGTAGEVTTIQISYPAADAAVATISNSIFNSFQKAGAVAASVSKVPQANWQYMNFKGLRFEVPDSKAVTACGAKVSGPTVYNSTPYCYAWGSDNIVRVEYRTYNMTMPTAAQAAQTHIDILKKIDADTNTRAARTYSTENVSIAGATVVKVKAYAGYGTAGTNQETYFIRRGNEMWVLETYEFVRWNYTKEAVRRIQASIRF